jgi:hypothetical protein
MEEHAQIGDGFTQRRRSGRAFEVRETQVFQSCGQELGFHHGREAYSESFRWVGCLSQGSLIMRNQDLISDGFLTLTVASLVLLGSSLLAFAFI